MIENCQYCSTRLEKTYITADTFEPKVIGKPGQLTACPRCDSPTPDDQELTALSSHQSLKCRYCETRWPAEERYVSCPLCREPTTGTSFPGIPPAEAEARANQHDFGWFLWDRGAV